MRLLYYNSSRSGGVAEYAREQATALAELGVDVTMMAHEDAEPPVAAPYEFCPVLRPPLDRDCGWYSPIRKLEQLRRVAANVFMMIREVGSGSFDAVLIGSFFEEAAPLWAWRLRRLRKRRVPVGAVVHEPVREHKRGPRWWHHWSVARAYGCLSHAFVHQQVNLDTVRPQRTLKTVVIPHGPYHFPEARRSREEVRQGWGIPRTARVVLSFGQIRDGKNIDLVMRAMHELPDHYLIVVGREQSDTDRTAEWYAQLADTLGLLDRVRVFPGHVPAEAVGNLFEGADIVLTTYSRGFRSASAVLNVAVTFRKPVLASSGEGNLREMVKSYDLGVWVEPDDEAAIVEGLQQLASNPPHPAWERYIRENSWEENAKRVLAAIG